MRICVVAGLVLAGLTAVSGNAAAASTAVSVGAGISTLGYGADVNAQLSKRFSTTLGYSTFSVDGDEDTDDVHYAGDLKSDNVTLTLNWHPFAGGFHVAVGAIAGDLQAAVQGSPRAGGSYEFNGVTYQAADVGELRGTVSIKDSVAPYAGLGWRSRGDGLGAYLNVGVMAAKTEVSLMATGAIGNGQFAADLEAERAELESKVDLSLYPVIGAGLIYRF